MTPELRFTCWLIIIGGTIGIAALLKYLGTVLDGPAKEPPNGPASENRLRDGDVA